MRIGEILMRVGRVDAARRIVGYMLDPSAGWHNADGGWAPYDRKHTESDLWASVYAFNLLSLYIESGTPAATVRKQMLEEIDKTIAWLAATFSKEGWNDESVTSQQNVPFVAAEIGPGLLRYGPALASSVKARLAEYIGPAGTLREDYYQQLVHSSRASASVRLAFAFAQLGIPRGQRAALERDAMLGWGQACGTAEVAMLLHLVAERSPTARVI